MSGQEADWFTSVWSTLPKEKSGGAMDLKSCLL